MFERWYELTVKTWEKATRTPLRTPLIFKRPQTLNLNHYKEQHISGEGTGKTKSHFQSARYYFSCAAVRCTR